MLHLLALALAAEPLPVTTTSDGITIDGRFDESAWATATPVTDLIRFQPTAGGPPPGTTEIRVLQDERMLYFGIHVRGADYNVRGRVSPREDINEDDQIGIYIDTFGDQLSGYKFYFNAIGIQQDMVVGPGTFNFRWDTVLHTKGRLVDDGFDLEVGIPFRSLKFPASTGGDQTWGLILTRKIPHANEKFSYPVLQRNHPREFSQAIPLTGVRPPGRGSGLEIIPGLTAVQTASADQPGDPLGWSGLDPWHDAIHPSVDLRMGLTPNIGLAAAINPDFSQIEADETPIALNQRFAFFYEERRPFFIEGSNHFNDQAATLYSRSIVEPLFGTKVSGKEGPWALGALHTLDLSPGASAHELERGDAEEGTIGGFSAADVEGARAESTMMRLKHDAFSGGYVGGTVATKRILADGPRGTHHSASLDTQVPLGDRWTATGVSFHSFTGPSPGDTTWGTHSQLSVNRASGVGTGFAASVSDRTPGVRKELGFLNQSALTTVSTRADYTVEPEAAFIDTYTPSVSGIVVEERDGNGWVEVETDHELQVGVHELEVDAGWTREDEDGARATGGKAGVSYKGQAGAGLGFGVATDVERALDYSTLATATLTSTTVDLTLRPRSGIRLDTRFRYATKTPDGFDLVDATLARAKLTYQFTPELGLRVIEEHTTTTGVDPRLVSSVLLTWLEHPGTAVHIGYADATVLGRDGGPTNRTVFAKGTFLFRP
jgi:hypothetical protein